MIDLLSYTTMDLHAACRWRGVARRRGCSASVSRPLHQSSTAVDVLIDYHGCCERVEEEERRPWWWRKGRSWRLPPRERICVALAARRAPRATPPTHGALRVSVLGPLSTPVERRDRWAAGPARGPGCPGSPRRSPARLPLRRRPPTPQRGVLNSAERGGRSVASAGGLGDAASTAHI